MRTAPDPLVAAKMALLRVQHAADMPDPGQLARKLDDLARNGVALAGPAPSETGAPAAAAPPAPRGMDWAALVDLVDHSGQLRLAQVMRDWVRVVDLARGELTYTLAPGYSGDPSGEIREALLRATGERWTVTRAEGDARPTLRELSETAKAEADAALRAHPLVAATLAAFPGAELIADEPEPKVASQGQRWRK